MECCRALRFASGHIKNSSLGGGLVGRTNSAKRVSCTGGLGCTKLVGRFDISFSLQSSGGPNLAFRGGARRVNFDIGTINFCIGGQFYVDLGLTAEIP